MSGMDMPDVTTKSTATSMLTTSTSTSTAALGANMSGMTMDGCKISMLWNWYTVGTCFLSSSWKIHSGGGFAGLCIGVILLVLLLQALGWAAKFYDKRLVRLHQVKAVALATQAAHNPSTETNGHLIAKSAHNSSPMASFRPNLWQQAIRALIRTMQFAVSYWIMLLAMYYNGYIIICIILGAFIGTYIFQWERMGGPHASVPDGHADQTGCCG
ncbi:hypothetical protein JX265_006008 [Neoarthrinium moseri]|uniref:Copper transport protein n=1 Tax=Neoarthrinium moseri TaxID=1658444 RepID=A0A9P9WMH3_9PEZI|nr:uncharacterized protein JN550_004227 [Neoarthrinium moseri]KAI1855605.1 hypothetical protein JX266_000470 [Neoarthrinium moseri]KAI1870968.1 hypothetical protein JX265_006008 [Neoarthrinium moseri]KAI1872024.1 hypothetical protein JN550_004227 [Neoarthrinium moseri]